MKITVFDDGPIRRVSKSGAQNLYRSLWYQFSANGREIHKLAVPRVITEDEPQFADVSLESAELPWLREELAKSSHWNELHNRSVMRWEYAKIGLSPRFRAA